MNTDLYTPGFPQQDPDTLEHLEHIRHLKLGGPLEEFKTDCEILERMGYKCIGKHTDEFMGGGPNAKLIYMNYAVFEKKKESKEVTE